MRLEHLLPDKKAIQDGGWADLEVTALTADSRSVEPGVLFVALRGTTHDGHQFLDQAQRRGAVCAVGEEPDPGLEMPYVQVSDSRRTLAHMAAAWNGFPSRKLVMIGGPYATLNPEDMREHCDILFHSEIEELAQDERK